MKFSSLLIALVAAAIAIPGVVRATTISGSITLPANLTTNQTLDFCNNTNYNTAGCEFVVPDLTLPGHDTLNSVTISLTWTGTTTINIDNKTFSNSETDGDVQTRIKVNLVDPNTGDAEASVSSILLPGTYTSFCVGKGCANDPSSHSTSGEFETIGPFTDQTATATLQLTDSAVLAGLLAGDVITFSTYTQSNATFADLNSNSNTDILPDHDRIRYRYNYLRLFRPRHSQSALYTCVPHPRARHLQPLRLCSGGSDRFPEAVQALIGIPLCSTF